MCLICRPKLVQVGKSDDSVLLSLCQATAGVHIICVNALQILCTYIWGALSRGGSWLWDFGEGAEGRLQAPCFLTLLHPALARRFALLLARRFRICFFLTESSLIFVLSPSVTLFLSDRWVVIMWCSRLSFTTSSCRQRWSCVVETHLSQQGDVVVAFFCEPDYLELLAS